MLWASSTKLGRIAASLSAKAIILPSPAVAANAYIACVYFVQLTFCTGKSSEWYPAYQVAAMRPDVVFVELVAKVKSRIAPVLLLEVRGTQSAGRKVKEALRK